MQYRHRQKEEEDEEDKEEEEEEEEYPLSRKFHLSPRIKLVLEHY